MTTAPSSAGMPLRQLRWPALPPMDLLEECHWLVTLDSRSADPARKPRDIEGHARHKLDPTSEMHTRELQNLSKHKSPYRRPLRRSKAPAPSPGSPAQRAAKSILKLKEGLLRLDDTRWTQDCKDDQATGGLPPHQLIHAHEQQNASRPGDQLSRQPNESTLSGTSPSRAKTPQRSPSRKTKKRPPTREERELNAKQERLAAWLKANPDATPASVDQGSGRTSTPTYSMEVQARVESAMQCRGPLESGVRLWDDPVRSLLAAEMTSESVFGGLIPTKALAFESRMLALSWEAARIELPQSSCPHAVDESLLQASPSEQALLSTVEPPTTIDLSDQTNEEGSHEHVEMSDHAQKVFNVAHRQVVDGAVGDALATLEAGIRQSLSTSQAHLDAVSRSHGAGFNYSVLAHNSATKLQLHYRARHRRRVNTLVFLQRQWRWWYARQRALKSLQYANTQATVIQQRYRPWRTHITQVRSVVRIQRCFRVFAGQKHVIRFRQICRLLLARRARCRQLKTRMRMLGRIVLLLRKRRRRIALIQGLWRRRCARAELAALLDHVSASELSRRAREDEFVAAKLAQVRVHLKEFLSNTKPGRKLVQWQQDKPWLRFRRLRHAPSKWDELPMGDKVGAVTGILRGRRFRGLHLRALCQILVGRGTQPRALPKMLEVSKESLELLAEPSGVLDASKMYESLGCCACCPWWAGARGKVERARAKLFRRAAAMWWALVTYPKEYCAAQAWPMRRGRRDQAREQVEDNCTRTLEAFCRVWFRRIDSIENAPPYACEWCSEAFGTSREYFAHEKCAAARALAEAEWTALSQDLQFERRKWWRLAKHTHDSPVRRDIYTLDLDAASVQHLRRTHSRRKALVPLVAILEACTASDSPNAVIPLDLAGFLQQYLDDSTEDSHPLMHTAEHQLVQWSTLVGSMEVESSKPTPEGSGRESRWIRRDELRARLLVGSKWKGVLSRWQRSLGRHAQKYRRVPASNAVAMWRGLQLRMRKTRRGSKTPLSPSAAGTRVLPVAT
ncbi:hypothetical protein PF010_g27113 [Phytophthora fragariae]|uniref:Uncharacterized protein n=1 Tax=Phytophthora fragariae TaxID=53985 RepID=A0A6G0JUR6_9STRA|nr:hypothetical protein PF010_g27113 [Phytophthora fragariae]